jgi:acyl-coenzyme A thioesterase PaaI-like protein
MLYHTVGPALLATPEPDGFQSTAELASQFHRPVRPYDCGARGCVVHREGEIPHGHDTLHAGSDEPVVTATAVCRVIPLGRARLRSVPARAAAGD